MATKTTKRTAATRTAKKTTAKRTASCKKETPRVYTFVALSLCFMITALVATVIMVGTKLNNDALAKNLEADRNNPGATIIYVDPAEETPEQ
ncbi:hypothetical protein IJ765_00675 [Candidatus Saccharibacteria bacterium]|nr:hypothetical protein [Candidatus Saccharibacteria bacterium]